MRGGGWGATPAAPGAHLDNQLMQEILHHQKPSAVSHGPQGPSGLTPPASGSSVSELCPAPACPTQASLPLERARITPAPFDAYVVLDFEATCEANRRVPHPEVIEFPMVVVDPVQCAVVAEFQRYVRPIAARKLSAFCVELTGITQRVVDHAKPFPSVYTAALDFLKACGLGDASPSRSYCIVTCGDWDLGTMLPAQMRTSGQLGTPESWSRWCNLKKYMKDLKPPLAGRNSKPVRINGMPDMLAAMGLALQGRHHSGIDDCRNIAAVLCALLSRGHVVTPTNVPSGTYTQWRAPAEAGHQPMAQLPSSIVPPSERPPPSVFVEPTSRPSTESSGKRQAPAPHQKNLQTTTAAAGASSPSGAAPRVAVRDPPLVVDTTRSAVTDLLAHASPTVPRRTVGELKTISKAMSYLLRHGADKERIRMTENGYSALDDVLRAKTVVRAHVTPADVARLVEDNDKQRYRLEYGRHDGKLYICATQGHSLEGVMPDLRRITEASEVLVAVHGTYWTAWNDIKRCGFLSAMTRHHIHFAKGLLGEDGVISGMRANVEVLLYADVPKLLADGVPLWESANGVLLTPGVGDTRQLPLAYIKKAVDKKTGHALPLS